MHTWGIPVVGFISSRAEGIMAAVFVGVGSFVGVSQVFCVFYYLLCERVFFWRTALCGWFIILSTLFILTYMEEKFSGEHSSRVNF